MNSRKLVVPLIVIVAILSIVLIGTVIYVLINKSNNVASNQEIVDINKEKNENALHDELPDEINENTNQINELQNVTNIDNTQTDEINEVIGIEPQNNNSQSNTSNTSTDDMEKVIFNNKFMNYLGDITGVQLAELIQLAGQESMNSTSAQPHVISFTSNNLQVINGILETDIYTVTFAYDENGYINTINIDKKM